MSQWLPILPVLIPFATGAICFLARGREGLERPLALIGTLALLAVSIALIVTVWTDGIQVVQMGAWAAPFGITMVADHLSAVMVLITAITGLAVLVYGFVDIDGRLEAYAYHPFLQILLAGVSGAFLTGDIFNLYVWFEVMLIASFGLLTLGGTKEQLDAGVKYVALNLVSTILFLSAIGLLYGMTGTLNMADLHIAIQEVENQGLVTAVAMMFMVAFGIKSAVFPLFFWLPAAYHTPPVAISAVFSGLLTKVGVYALIRVFTLIFTGDTGYTHTILLWVAGLTMVTGVLGAAAQNEMRRILSFHIISQIGYMLVGVALMTPLAIAGSILYIVHHIIVKANLFLVAGVIRQETGSFALKRIGGLWAVKPLLGLMFLIPALSLAGIPPLSGFWGKFVVIRSGLEAQAWLLAGVSLAVGVLTLYSMIKIWNEAFWKAVPEDADAPTLLPWSRRERAVTYAPIVALGALTLTIGLFTEPFAALSMQAAESLLDRNAYIAAVLGPDALRLAKVTP